MKPEIDLWNEFSKQRSSLSLSLSPCRFSPASAPTGTATLSSEAMNQNATSEGAATHTRRSWNALATLGCHWTALWRQLLPTENPQIYSLFSSPLASSFLSSPAALAVASVRSTCCPVRHLYCKFTIVASVCLFVSCSCCCFTFFQLLLSSLFPSALPLPYLTHCLGLSGSLSLRLQAR